MKVIETNTTLSVMDHLPPPDASDPGYLRTRAAYHHLIHTLGKSLPPPSPDTPEARYQRNQAAIAQIAALCPTNPAEAALAAQFVAASEQAMDCLRLTHAPETPGTVTLKCNAQAASMMRQAQSAMRTLLRVQAARQKQNADSAAWSEYAIGQMMADSLTDPNPLPPPDPLSASDLLTTPAALSASEAPPPASPLLAEPSGPPAPADAVETYIHLYPKRAAEIRRARGMPRNASFAPPDDDIIKALAAGTAPALRLLDPAAVCSHEMGRSPRKHYYETVSGRRHREEGTGQPEPAKRNRQPGTGQTDPGPPARCL